MRTSLERELRWAGARIAHCAARLSQYVELRDTYEKRLTAGDEKEAGETLDGIQQGFGLSLWVIKTRLHFLDRTAGLEAQKRYVSSVKSLAEGNGLASFVMHYTSVRNESNVSLPRYSSDIEGVLATYPLLGPLEGHIRSHLLPFHPLQDEEALVGALRYDSEMSAVDHYESLITVAKHLVASGSPELLSVLGEVLAGVYKKVLDPRVLTLAFDTGQSKIVGMPPRCDWGPFEAELTGGAVLERALSAVQKEPDVFEHIVTAAGALASTGGTVGPGHTEWFTDHIDLVRRVLESGKEATSAASELTKAAVNTASLSWGQSTYAFLLRTSSPLTEQSETAYGAATSGVPYIHPCRLDGLSSPTLRAGYASILTTENDALGAYINGFITGKVGRAVAPEVRPGLEVAVAATRHQWDQVVHQIEPSIPAHPFDRVRALRALARSYVELGMPEEAVRLVADWAVRSPHLVSYLPVQGVGDLVDRAVMRSMRGDVALPVFLEVYTRRVGADRTADRNDAAEDFLEAQGLEKPSQIGPVADQFDRGLLLYYLRYVCVESVMDSSVVYEGSRDLAEERQAVCSLLARLDPSNSDLYTSEAHDIGRRLTIQRRMREIETSRIYVDVDGVRRAAEVRVREAFNRYAAYIRDGIDDETSATLAEAASKAEEGDVDALMALQLPQNEVRALLAGIVTDIRDEFVSSTEHGLDGYLSVRVRHGALSNELRIPLESAHLVTKEDGTTGEYRDNDHWPEAFGLDLDTADALSAELSTFSRGVDELIQEIKDDWIQIKRSPKDTGLFDFMLREFEVSYMASGTHADTPFEEFLEKVLDHFRTRLQVMLKVVQREVTTLGKRKANELMGQLQRRVNDLGLGWQVGELTAAINLARTNLFAAFDRVGEWFQLSAASRQAAFSLDEIVSISEAHIQRSVPEFHAAVTYDPVDRDDMNPQEIVIVNNLVSFGDVMFMALDNVVKHSHLGEAPSAAVTITLLEEPVGESRIRFRIENQLGPGAASVDNHERVAALRQELREDRLGEAVSTEGGTGLLKIWKTILHDFDMPDAGSKPNMDFGFCGQDRFFLSFEFPVRYSSLVDHDAPPS